MPLLISGKTTCGLCSKIIGKDDEVFAVPPLIYNSLDPLFNYNDSVFHAKCAKENVDFKKLAQLIVLWEKRSAGKISFLSGKPITIPEDFFSFPYLGDDPQLAKISFQVCNKHELSKWPELPNIIRKLEDLQSSGVWNREVLAKFMTELRIFISYHAFA
ncbi:MAG: hypothetical protein IAF00_04165 [Phycisphaerales bacterium]|nr:hypothetical protein [Phycisphaerales bacterium]